MGRVWTSSVIIVPPFDAATIAWVNAVVTNGGTVSAGRETIVDNLIVGLKADGVFSKFDRLWLLAGENQPSGLTDIIADSLATAVNSPTFTTDRGFASNGSTSYINSGYNPSTNGVNWTLNSAHGSSWSVSTPTNGALMSFGALVGGSAPFADFICNFTFGGNTGLFFRLNQDAPPTASYTASGAGHYLGNRSGSSASQGYQNGSSLGSDSNVSTTVPNLTAYILARNNAGTADDFCTDQLAAISFGGSLSSTDVTNFYNRLRTYMTAVGVP